MKTEETFQVNIKKIYSTNLISIIKLFEDHTIFKLTGADEVEVDFRTGENFKLTFKNRGTIFGKFILISEEKIIMDWNVEGFERPNEVHTHVEICFEEENEKCIVSLIHRNIPLKESANAKNKAWTEIFNTINSII